MFAAAPSPGPNRAPLPPADRPRRQRDSFFDNAKYLAIVLVAMGHALAPVKGDSRALEAVYNVVYTFHMPAFIIISGFFSRSFDMRPDRLKRLVTGVAVPYVLFETAYSLFRIHVGDSADRQISLLTPWYLTWFLCALFVWRLISPLWKLLRHPLPVALGVAMLASLAPSVGGELALPRVLQFLPCFVLGLCMKPEHFQLVRRRWVRVAAVPVFAAALAFGWWSAAHMDVGWFYRENAAQDLHAPWWTGPLMTLAMFGCALLLTACFYAWVPGRRMWFTSLGQGTLYGYLLHGFVIKACLYAGWFDVAQRYGPAGAALVTVLAAGAVTLLCTHPVRRVFRFAMEPRMEWAFRQDAAQLARERRETPERERERAGAVSA
ncbi:acyltransferase family protein [Streptomyces sp. NPDC005728]|uniref:acyltransferase family protein n=1 Tax=Streptomyces sp. NPDC005728 TaxID=3157054 RepID=UPI0033C47E6A